MVKRAIGRLAATGRGGWRRGWFGMKRRLRLLGEPMILPFTGHATPRMLWLKGRVLEDEGVVGAPPPRSTAAELWRTFLRYETDEIAGARVAYEGAGTSGTFTVADDGYFQLRLPNPDLSAARDGWMSIELTLLDAPGYRLPAEPVRAVARVRVPGPAARFVVVSDIDDTIMHTGAEEMLRNWRIVISNSPQTRVAFPGVPEFYRALADGPDGVPDANPIFYVSSSPWNLYDLVEGFLHFKGIPKGPIFLRNLSRDWIDWLRRRHSAHKEPAIRDLLAAYPDMPFVLIGDSGQRDAEIYARLAAEHPGRIRAVHIHEVRPVGAGRDVEEHLARIDALGIPATLGATLASAADCAEALGLVAAGSAERVRRAMAARAEVPAGRDAGVAMAAADEAKAGPSR
ncbi:App1 family protein [Antarcticirhabdus aurantiaca]|uniref:DUF2183 domain-containing protein n=1 Tax=Antarcticirhabdus aurantiaca TaxID=2606717 RepID=A0ACD4NL30_9HYPH|nr:phosphatase domain-containing protein [Antarcticirhabdus aurantiaca]WAJ27456.1 DUF2183 domain-containing protein [Jeongeuplla avenae]